MSTRPTPETSGASQSLRTRIVAYLKLYTETVEPLEVQPQAGGSSAAVGAVRTAFKRSTRYNDKKTTIAAPKPA